MSATILVALAALVFLGYTYVGYPLLIALLARAFPWRPQPDPTWEPTVSVCMAVHNCRALVDAKLRSLTALDYPPNKIEFLVYSDGSDDGTDAIVADWTQKDVRIRLFRGDTRKGKPAALNCLRDQATGEVLLLTDARQVIERPALRALLCLLAAPRVGCVTGNLVLEGGAGSGMYWRYEKWIRRQESRTGCVVGMTGALAALRRNDMGELPPDLILDDVWIPMRMRLRGAHVLLVENAIAHDEAFSDEREFGRKVRTLAGNYQLFSRMPGLLLPFVNPSWFETVSHKVARLLCPWCLVALFGGSALGAAGIGAQGAETAVLRGFFLAQIAFYGMAALGSRAGRVGTLARTFVMLNAAAVMGLWTFVAGRQKVTW